MADEAAEGRAAPVLIRTNDLALQEFDASLTEVVYQIRNHPSVREYLRTSAPISRESHLAWVNENLILERRLRLFVVLARDAPVGIALLRNFRERCAEIGLMMVEAPRRRLVSYKAALLIGHFGFEVLGLEKLLSYVARHNEHALSFDLRCGFERTGRDSEAYFELALSRERSRGHRTHRRFRSKYSIEILRAS